MRSAGDVAEGVGHRAVEVVEEVVLVGEAVERADRVEHPEVLGARHP